VPGNPAKAVVAAEQLQVRIADAGGQDADQGETRAEARQGHALDSGPAGVEEEGEHPGGFYLVWDGEHGNH